MDDLDMFTRAGLEKLFTDNHFSICQFKDLCELRRVTPPKWVLDRLDVVHCVNWNRMEPELRQRIMDLIIETLQLPPLVIEHSGHVRSPRTGLLKLVKGE